jgi:hypothetical protein
MVTVTDENSEIDDGHNHNEHLDEDNDGEPDVFKERVFDIMRTNDQLKDCDVMKG